tara:strand:- start:123 stop:326 length:204 start_codon:yes stop_codon:yes gene_type:complete
MSNEYNERLLELYFEEGLEMGMSDKQAEKYAREKFADSPEPDYKVKGGISNGRAIMKKRGGTFKGTF